MTWVAGTRDANVGTTVFWHQTTAFQCSESGGQLLFKLYFHDTGWESNWAKQEFSTATSAITFNDSEQADSRVIRIISA